MLNVKAQLNVFLTTLLAYKSIAKTFRGVEEDFRRIDKEEVTNYLIKRENNTLSTLSSMLYEVRNEMTAYNYNSVCGLIADSMKKIMDEMYFPVETCLPSDKRVWAKVADYCGNMQALCNELPEDCSVFDIVDYKVFFEDARREIEKNVYSKCADIPEGLFFENEFDQTAKSVYTIMRLSQGANKFDIYAYLHDFDCIQSDFWMKYYSALEKSLPHLRSILE